MVAEWLSIGHGSLPKSEQVVDSVHKVREQILKCKGSSRSQSTAAPFSKTRVASGQKVPMWRESTRWRAAYRKARAER